MAAAVIGVSSVTIAASLAVAIGAPGAAGAGEGGGGVTAAGFTAEAAAARFPPFNGFFRRCGSRIMRSQAHRVVLNRAISAGVVIPTHGPWYQLSQLSQPIMRPWEMPLQ